MCASTIVFLDYDCYDSVVRGTDIQYVAFDETLCQMATEHGLHCRNGRRYVDDSKKLVTDTDYDRMRAWLTDLEIYKDIDLGLMMQNTFMYNFCRQLFRQLRIIRTIIDVEQPDRILVYSRGRARYEWNNVGDERVDPALVRAVCSETDIEVTVRGSRLRTRLKDTGFQFGSPWILSAAERTAETFLRLTSEPPSYDASEILVHLANSNNLDTILPVIRTLIDHGRSVRVIYQSHGFFNVDKTTRESLKELGTSVQPFETYQDRSVYKTVRTMNHRFRTRWQTISTNKSIINKFKLDDIPVWEVLKDRLWLYYRIQFPRLVKYIETGLKIISKEKPSVVLTKADGPTPVRTFVNVANSQQIPTVVIQHGVKSPINDYIPPSKHVAVWGETAKEFFQQKGLKSNRLHVTGAPHFDGLASYDTDQNRIRKSLNIPNDHNVVMLASQPFADEVRYSVLNSVFENVVPLDDTTVVLRPHPREDHTLHQEFADNSDGDVRIAAEEDIHDLIITSDIVLAINSTVIFESSLLGTPVLVISFTDERDHPFYSPANGYPRITDPNALSESVSSVLQSDRNQLRNQQPSFGKEYAYNSDGRASQRVASLIERLIDGRPTGNINDY